MSVTVDIHMGHIAAQSDNDARYLTCLSDEEIAKINAIKKAAQRSRLIETRAFLRQHLAHYTGQPAPAIRIERSEHGKPYLTDFPRIQFNLSHSGDSLLLAICKHSPPGLMLGVDIEVIRPRVNLPGVVSKCFSIPEQAAWQQLPRHQQLAAFFQSWTAKEAFAKAIGRGLAIGLHHVEIQSEPDYCLANIPAQYGSAEHWQLHALTIHQRHAAMLCINSSCQINVMA